MNTPKDDESGFRYFTIDTNSPEFIEQNQAIWARWKLLIERSPSVLVFQTRDGLMDANGNAIEDLPKYMQGIADAHRMIQGN